MSDTVTPASQDPRPPALGAARVLMAALVVFALYALVASSLTLAHALRPGTVLNVLTAVVWGVIAVGVIHNGRRMRAAAAIGLFFQALGLVVSAAAETAQAQWILGWNLWRGAGESYWWIPAVLLVITVWWMVISDPRRLAGR